MNRRQTKVLVIFVATTALLAIAIAWTTTSVPIPRAYVVWCVIVAALWTAIPRWPNPLLEGVATGIVIASTIPGLMHHYYTPLTFASIAWWQGIALYVAAQLVAQSVRFWLLLTPRSRRRNRGVGVTICASRYCPLDCPLRAIWRSRRSEAA